MARGRIHSRRRNCRCWLPCLRLVSLFISHHDGYNKSSTFLCCSIAVSCPVSRHVAGYMSFANPLFSDCTELLNPATSRGLKRSRSPDTYQDAAASETLGGDGKSHPAAGFVCLSCAPCYLCTAPLATRHLACTHRPFPFLGRHGTLPTATTPMIATATSALE